MQTSQKSLSDLVDSCLEERESYLKRTQAKKDRESACCLEIVHRAVKGDSEALEVLIQITYPIVLAGCRIKRASWGIEIEDCEDITQDTLLVMTNVLKRTNKTFEVRTFGQYVAYVKTVLFSSAMNFLKRRKYQQQLGISLDEGFKDREKGSLAQEVMGATDQTMQEVDVKLSIDQLLAKCIDDPLEREILKWRHSSGEKIEDITERLKLVYPGITKDQVYRMLAYAIRRLNNCPEIKYLRSENQRGKEV